jgi:hypothetical protein
MDAAELQSAFDRAFRNAARPATFTACHCPECEDLDALLQTRDHSNLDESDICGSICFLSPEGLTYWAPALVRICLSQNDVSESNICDQYINSMLGQPLQREKIYTQHPRFTQLNAEQSSLILSFLVYINDTGYTQMNKETPRELARAICNWKRLATQGGRGGE